MKRRSFILLAVIFVFLLGLASYLRPVPLVGGTANFSPPSPSSPVSLPWPAYGQGALGAQNFGVLQTHGEQKSAPMASVAKVITALAVLKKKPLQASQSGPSITITADDIAIYNDYYLKGGSVAKVVAGEQLSELQALQAMLLPSANNIADTLANWAFGSVNDYISYANSMVKDMGLTKTTLADASGFLSESVSSAQDLVNLGLTAMNDPVFADIVKQQSVNLPVAGTVNNVNWLLGNDGVIGIKTGNTDQSGGCFLFAANRAVLNQTVTIVGAIIQAPDLNTAIKDARSIVLASDNGFEKVQIASKGQVVGSYTAPWKNSAPATVSQDISLINWRGNKVQPSLVLNYIKAPIKTGATVGSLTARAGQQTASSSVELNTELSGPNWSWRIFH